MIPFRRLIGLACAHLKWTPAAFWASTPHELYASVEALDVKKWVAGDRNLTQELDAMTEDDDGG